MISILHAQEDATRYLTIHAARRLFSLIVPLRLQGQGNVARYARQYFTVADAATARFAICAVVRRFRPDGATECSHGWSGAAAMRPEAEPVESG
jgi:hypothetical protein